MSRRENDETTLPWDEIMLLPYPKPQDDKKNLSEEHMPPAEQKSGIWPLLRASIAHKYHNCFKSWAAYTSKPWNMCLLVLIGVAFAIGHHLFYNSLDGEEAINQSRMLRYGTVLAFFAKASFGTAAAMAFQQRAWLVVRHKMARLETIDSLFTANSDVFALLTWSSIKKAKIATLIAVYCWVTPLLVVLTPETLSVVVEERAENGTCPNVRTLNFANEKRFYWRDIEEGDPKSSSLSKIWNTTAAGKSINKDDPNEFDYWAYPGWSLEQVIAPRVALENKALVLNSSGAGPCSHGWNCSYILDFTAPGYKCEEIASGVNSEVRKLGKAASPDDISTNLLAPKGNFTYFAATKFGEFTNQVASNFWRRPKQGPPYPASLGAFRTEPIMWIGYSTVEDYSKKHSFKPGQGDWWKAYKPILLGCEHYEVNYTVQFEWIGERQSHKVLRREYLRKVVNTTLVSTPDPDTRLADRTSAVPASNYVLPTNVEEYRLIAAYHSLGCVFRDIFQGRTTLPNFNSISRISATPLFDLQTFLPIRDFSQAIREMYENMIVSLLSDPSLWVTSWVSNGQPTGNATSDPSSKGYPCLKKRYTGFFEYNKTQLIIVYAVNTALAIVAVLLGLHAYWEEGEMRDMKPSSIIEASRASDLHALDNKSEVKIGYGVVQNDAGRSVRSFGVEGNLTQPGRQWY